MVEIDFLVQALPHVSIVILTYNGARFMRDLLPSLLDQTYPAHQREIIVIDNDSKDDTVSYIQRNFPEIKCIALPENIGFAAGNNVGYQHAKNDYIIFLNQDTICHRDWLAGLVTPLLEDQEIGACASNIIPVDPQKAAGVDRETRVDTLFYCDLSPFGYGRYHEEVKSPPTAYIACLRMRLYNPEGNHRATGISFRSKSLDVCRGHRSFSAATTNWERALRCSRCCRFPSTRVGLRS